VIDECHQWARREKFTGTAAGQRLLYGRRRGHPETAAAPETAVS
jgi:WhiB family transcriptional regulator, redox-sensing transcriptional regulator